MKHFGMPTGKKQQGLILALLILVILTIGVAVLVFQVGQNRGGSEGKADSDPSASSEVTAVGPAPDIKNPGPATSSSAKPEATLSPEDGAKDAIQKTVPVWGSYDYARYKNNQDAWMDQLDSAPVDSDFTKQTKDSYYTFFGPAQRMHANIIVDGVKDMSLSWRHGDDMGWKVTFDRKYTPADGSGLHEQTETMAWEIVTHRGTDGTTTLKAFNTSTNPKQDKPQD